MMVANARTRAHDSARYRLFEPFHRWIAGSFSVFAFQSEEDLKRAGKVIAPGTKTVAPGNLKFALRPAPDESKANSLAQWLQPDGAPILAAGSLEEGDLAFVLEAFQAVRDKTACRLMVAPRRLQHVQAMRRQAEMLILQADQRLAPERPALKLSSRGARPVRPRSERAAQVQRTESRQTAARLRRTQRHVRQGHRTTRRMRKRLTSQSARGSFAPLFSTSSFVHLAFFERNSRFE